MANHDSEKQDDHAVRGQTKDGKVEEKDRGGDGEEVRLRWTWLKQHRASIVVGFCFVPVLALTILLPLLLVQRAGTDEV
jgi:hypothetical protein